MLFSYYFYEVTHLMDITLYSSIVFEFDNTVELFEPKRIKGSLLVFWTAYAATHLLYFDLCHISTHQPLNTFSTEIPLSLAISATSRSSPRAAIVALTRL